MLNVATMVLPCLRNFCQSIGADQEGWKVSMGTTANHQLTLMLYNTFPYTTLGFGKELQVPFCLSLNLAKTGVFSYRKLTTYKFITNTGNLQAAKEVLRVGWDKSRPDHL